MKQAAAYAVKDNTLLVLIPFDDEEPAAAIRRFIAGAGVQEADVVTSGAPKGSFDKVALYTEVHVRQKTGAEAEERESRFRTRAREFYKGRGERGSPITRAASPQPEAVQPGGGPPVTLKP
jgi:hypothetical protein